MHDWGVMTPKQARLTVGFMPVWDYNETCIAGRTVRFSGRHVRFSDREIRAWNTAIMFAVEEGLVPALIGERGCPPPV